MQQCIYWSFLSSTCFGRIRPLSWALDVKVAAYGFLHRVFGWVVVLRTAVWVVCTVRMLPCARQHAHRTQHRPTQRLSRPTTIQKLGAENHWLQLNVWRSWWWAYVPETCRAKETSIKLPCCIKLAFQIISWGRCTVKQPSSRISFYVRKLSRKCTMYIYIYIYIYIHTHTWQSINMNCGTR